MANRTQRQDANIVDPEGNFIFMLEIDGVAIAQFLECSGIKTTTEVFEIEEGGMNDRVHKLPGQSRWENITLRYGVTADTSLIEWRSQILNDDFNTEFGDKTSRRNGAIVMKDMDAETEIRRYNFVNAWPVAYEGPTFNAQGAELAVEMIELAHHGITVELK